MQTSAARQLGSKVFGVAAQSRAAVCQPPRNNVTRRPLPTAGKEDDAMAFKRGEQVVESAQEARQAERGPSVRNLLVASTALAIIALAIIWFVFFRT
jgi:hypothetical protein